MATAAGSGIKGVDARGVRARAGRGVGLSVPSARQATSPAGAGGVRRWRFVLVVGSAPNGAPVPFLLDRVTSCVVAPHAVVLEEPFGPALRIRFDWPASSRAEAIAAAVRAVEESGLGVLRVDHDDWVTAGDVGLRIGRSREMVRLWATNQCGPGGFPPPVNPRRKTSFYSWAEVVPWLRDRLRVVPPVEEPDLVAANLVVQLRALLPRMSQPGALLDLLNEPGASKNAAGVR